MAGIAIYVIGKLVGQFFCGCFPGFRIRRGRHRFAVGYIAILEMATAAFVDFLSRGLPRIHSQGYSSFRCNERRFEGCFRLIGVVAFRASDNGFAVRAVWLKSVVFVIERRFAVFGKAVLAKRKFFRDRLIARSRLRCGCRVSRWRRWGCIGLSNCGRSNSRNADIANEHYARCQSDDTYHKDFQ